MNNIFEFGYEGGYDRAGVKDGIVHFHTDMECEFENRFDNMKDWWAYYIQHYQDVLDKWQGNDDHKQRFKAKLDEMITRYNLST